jgi:hypothetical protein
MNVYVYSMTWYNFYIWYRSSNKREETDMRKVYRSLFILHIFVGVGALFGGGTAVINPKTPFGITVEALKNSPFSDFLIPGIMLFGVIGLGNLLSALMFRFKSRFQGYMSSVFGWALVIWIVVQCVMLNAVAPPHVIFFLIGLVQAVLAMALLFEQRLFPANIVLSCLKK